MLVLLRAYHIALICVIIIHGFYLEYFWSDVYLMKFKGKYSAESKCMAVYKSALCYATWSEDLGTGSTSCISISIHYKQLFLSSNKVNDIKIYDYISGLLLSYVSLV
jgi:hypothetical protein